MKPIYYILFLILLLVSDTSLAGQGNPFEIKSRLEPTESATEEATSAPVKPVNDNPFEIAVPVPEKTGVGTAVESNQLPLVVKRNNEPDVLDARGRTLGIHVLLLFLMTLLWIFFRPLLTKCYRAIFNEGLLSQLYRQRENGQFSVFLICYALFFLSAGFFCYLLGQAFDLLPSDQPWQDWVYYSPLLTGLVMAKQLLLYFLAWLFPVKRDLGKYNFSLMIFGIIIGMLLVPVNLLISYAPADYTITVAWMSLILLGAIYLLRFFRGFLIANTYLDARVLHFLLYICTVEIAPVLILYRYFGG